MTANDKMTAEQVCEAIEALKFKAKEIEAAYANYQDLETRERQIQTQKAEAKNKLHKLIDKDRPLIKSVLKQPQQIDETLFKDLPSEEVPTNTKPKERYLITRDGCHTLINGEKWRIFLMNFCKERGFKPAISHAGIESRLKAGWAFEPAVFIPSLQGKTKYKTYTDGELSAYIKKYGDISLLQNLLVVKDRIYNLGWNFYKAITTPYKQAKGA